MQTFQIVVAGFDGCIPSGVVGLVDLFLLANIALERQPQNTSRFEITVASLNDSGFHDGRGQRLNADRRLKNVKAADAVVTPGFWFDAEHLEKAAPTFRAVRPWLKEQYRSGAWIGASCSGAYVLGEAGLLDGRRCTTTWWLCDAMKRRFPKADVAWGASLIEDKRIVTTSGPLSWIHLALHIVRALAGPEAARIVSDFAVIDATPSKQPAFMPGEHVAETVPFLVKAEQCVRQQHAAPLTAAVLAAHLSISTRTLHRRLKALTGEAPNTFIARVRIEAARMLLDSTASAVKDIALSVGYQDEGSFRRVFRQLLGMTPTDYRRWSRQRRGDRGL